MSREVSCRTENRRIVWRGAWRECEGQRHAEGGPAHSASTPQGLLIWWTYGNDRQRVILRES